MSTPVPPTDRHYQRPVAPILEVYEFRETGVWFTAAAMGASGLWVLIAARETLPGLARPD